MIDTEHWSDWLDLELAATAAPEEPGVYRIRCASDAHVGRLRYVGQTANGLRYRLHEHWSLVARLARRRGAGVYSPAVSRELTRLLSRGETLQVSWRKLEGLSKTELRGVEVDVIAAYRRLTGRNPDFQFGRSPGRNRDMPASGEHPRRRLRASHLPAGVHWRSARPIVTTEERLCVLQMVEEGRITRNESAELLDALGSRPDAEARDRRHWLYIRIVAPDGAVRLHAVVRLGLIRFAERFFYSRVLKAAHADLQKSLPWAMSAQPGETLQIPLESGEHVQISVEDSLPDFRPAPPPEPPPTKDEGPELEILSALERGEIDVEEALRRLEEQGS